MPIMRLSRRLEGKLILQHHFQGISAAQGPEKVEVKAEVGGHSKVCWGNSNQKNKTKQKQNPKKPVFLFYPVAAELLTFIWDLFFVLLQDTLNINYNQTIRY